MDEVERVIEKLNDSAPLAGWRAAKALEKIGKPAVPALIEALEDERLNVQTLAASALGKIGDGRAVEPLIEKLGHENCEVRWWTAEALGRIGDVRAVPALIDALDDRYAVVRQVAAEALGRIGTDEIVPSLIETLKEDSHWRVRFKAAEALGRMHWVRGKIEDERAVSPLIDALDDPYKDVREMAAWALEKIGFDKIGSNEEVLCRLISPMADVKMFGGSQSVPGLIAALKNRDGNVRLQAVRYLEEIAEEVELDFVGVQNLLHEVVETVEAKNRESVKRLAAKAYALISRAVSKRKKAEMPGVLSTGKIRPPKKGIYRTRRVA